MPLSPAASSFADSPSTMKLLEKLRWLPTDRSLARHRRCFGKELRAADVGRRDAGHQQRQVEEIAAVQRQALHFGLRDGAGDLTARGFEQRRLRRHGHAGVEGRRPSSAIGNVERRADGQRDRARLASAKPSRWTVISYGPTFRYGNRNRPSPSVIDSPTMFVSVWRADDVGAWHNRALRINDATAEAGVVDGLLRRIGRRSNNCHDSISAAVQGDGPLAKPT